MEPMAMKVTLSIVPDAACFDPVLPIDGIIVGHIWGDVMEGVVPTHAHFVYDEKWRLPFLVTTTSAANFFRQTNVVASIVNSLPLHI
jgi:hypothetical protein